MGFRASGAPARRDRTSYSWAPGPQPGPEQAPWTEGRQGAPTAGYGPSGLVDKLSPVSEGREVCTENLFNSVAPESGVRLSPGQAHVARINT